MQRERRSDPYPWTWELPVAGGVTTLLVLAVGVHLGRGMANVLAGAGWTWPTPQTGSFPSPIGARFWSSLPGVLSGDAGAGLDTVPARVAGTAGLWGSIAVVELLLSVGMAWAVALGYRRWGPGRMRGMASSAEAERLLGVTRLRRVAPIVRPDLHGHQADPPPVERTADQTDELSNIEIARGLSPWLLPSRTKARERR